MFKGKKVLIFDMDGTLIDSVGVWNAVDEALIERLRTDGKTETEDVQRQRDAALRRFAAAESPYLEYCRFLKEKYGFEPDPEEVHTIRYGIAQDYLRDTVDYKPDADVFVKMLKERGFTLVIATTTRRDNMNVYRTQNRNIIEKANIDDYFSPVYTREDAREIKPNPEIYLRVMNEFGLTPAECLIFEDSLIGLEAAKRAGIESVAVYDRYSDHERDEINALADHRADNYAQLIRILEEETGGPASRQD